MDHQSGPIWNTYGASIVLILRLAQDSQQFEGACTTAVKMLENLKDYRTLLPVASTTGNGFEGLDACRGLSGQSHEPFTHGNFW